MRSRGLVQAQQSGGLVAAGEEEEESQDQIAHMSALHTGIMLAEATLLPRRPQYEGNHVHYYFFKYILTIQISV